MRHHLLRAPSNIAWIKYMGKTDSVANLPENPSLSMTLHDLATWVSVEVRDQGDAIVLAPGVPVGSPAEALAPSLSAQGRDKVLKHCARVRSESARVLTEHGLAPAPAHDLSLRTGNTFPEASGIASSASSFAALTLAMMLACAADPLVFRSAYESDLALRRKLARLSRLGSGSSCRSFEGPFVLWQGESAEASPAPGLPDFAHFVLLISREAKAVSSSEAHARVKTSPLWSGRTDRVSKRLALLTAALAASDLRSLARLAWSEAWEMHSLFHTASEPFSYWKPGTIDTLHWLSPFLASDSPPIVTMDAGANVHVTVRSSNAAVWRARFHERFGRDAVLEDRPGHGAEIVS